MPDPKTPDAVDVMVGGNVRRRRTMLGVSQEKLAAQLGITFQQVQKYEKGTNRVSASKLVAISTALQCNVADLFAGTGGETIASMPLPPYSIQATRMATNFDKLPQHQKTAFALLLASMVKGEDGDQEAA
jgi:transcriptional regulator with XRE-family HTH domain